MGEDTSGFCGDKLADIRNKKIGFIFQDFYLMDSLSIEENIMLPMLIGKKKIQGIRKLVSEYAEQFQISHLLNKNPYELSGGEQGDYQPDRLLYRRGDCSSVKYQKN